jgi:starvation-inducible DNA-binding protein
LQIWKTQFGSQAMPTLHGSDTAAVHAPFPECRRKQRTHIDALSSALAAYGKHARHAIDADVFTEISRGVDEHLWFVEAHAG